MLVRESQLMPTKVASTYNRKIPSFINFCKNNELFVYIASNLKKKKHFQNIHEKSF